MIMHCSDGVLTLLRLQFGLDDPAVDVEAALDAPDGSFAAHPQFCAYHSNQSLVVRN